MVAVVCCLLCGIRVEKNDAGQVTLGTLVE
jgi:hypothetical protein